MQPPNIYVSNLSLFPRTMSDSIDIMNEADLAGFQLTPLRGWDDCGRHLDGNQIVAIEPPFWKRGESMKRAATRALLTLDLGILPALYAFGGDAWGRTDRFASEFSDALPVDTGHKNSLIEVSPANGIDHPMYLDASNGVVLDTMHLYENRPGHGMISQPRSLVSELLKAEKVKLVYVQFRNMRDMSMFSDKFASTHELMQRIAKSGCTAPVVIDLHPKLLLTNPVDKLTKLAAHIRSYY